jgi:hypothetical protein
MRRGASRIREAHNCDGSPPGRRANDEPRSLGLAPNRSRSWPVAFEAYREEPETVTIVSEDDTVVEVRALTRTGLIMSEARFDQTERGLRWLPARAGGAVMIGAL